jgi:hypothetical protein
VGDIEMFVVTSSISLGFSNDEGMAESGIEFASTSSFGNSIFLRASTPVRLDHSGSVISPSYMLDNIVTKRAAFDLGRALH